MHKSYCGHEMITGMSTDSRCPKLAHGSVLQIGHAKPTGIELYDTNQVDSNSIFFWSHSNATLLPRLLTVSLNPAFLIIGH